MGRANEGAAASLSEPDFQAREHELLVAHRARRIPHYRSLVLHWMGRWLRRPRRPVAAPLPTVEPGQVGISFAGHATALIRFADRTIVCDPMLGQWVGGIRRAVAPGLSPADLHDVDLILISHAHADHLHPQTLAQLPRSATVVVPPQCAQHVSAFGFARVIELGLEASFEDRSAGITALPVRHPTGDPASSYLVRGSGPSVYFCGDSGYFSGFAQVGARYAPDIAILPIGGYAPLAFRGHHMSPLDALYALEDLGARALIPIHHGAFSLSYEQLQEPSRWLGELVRERGIEDFVVELEPGESRVFVRPRSQHASSSAPAMTPTRPAYQSGFEHTAAGSDSSPGAREGRLMPLPALRAYRGMLGPRRPLAPAPAVPGTSQEGDVDELDLIIDIVDAVPAPPAEVALDIPGRPAIAIG